MSINETQYKIDIEGLQNALGMIHSEPAARLEIEPHRAQLTISGQYAWNVHGVEEIARVLDRTTSRWFETNHNEPVMAVLDKSAKRSREFAVIVKPDGVCNYILDAACSCQVNPGAVEAILADFRLDNCFALVFSLDGQPPYVLSNSAKPDTVTLPSEDIPFIYKDATGRIYQGPDGWGGEFSLGMIQMKLEAEFVGPETVQQELEFIVDNCHNFAIGSERDR